MSLLTFFIISLITKRNSSLNSRSFSPFVSHQLLDYEPPSFKGCTEEKSHNPWTKNPFKMEIGNVNSKHLILTLKVKSVLDPCEDENDDIQDDEVNLGADSVRMDDSSSDSDSEISQTQEGEYVIAPVGIITEKQRPEEDIGMADADLLKSCNMKFLLDDVFFNFPDISAVLTDGNKELYHRFQAQLKKIMGKLVKEGVLSKTGRGSYTIMRQKIKSYAHGLSDLLGIQIDAANNPGNIGGPAFNDQGECIGVAFQDVLVRRVEPTSNANKVLK